MHRGRSGGGFGNSFTIDASPFAVPRHLRGWTLPSRDGFPRWPVVTPAPTTLADVSRIFTTSFASVYPHYVTKAERKGRTKADVDQVIGWLTGFDEDRKSVV